MSGYVDLHCHLLPGVDDGVKTPEESLVCARAAAEAGFEQIVLTRHQMAGVYAVGRTQAVEGRMRLEEAARLAGLSLTFHDGAEHYTDDALHASLETGPETLAGSRALLIEMPSMHIPNFFSQLVFRVRLKGYFPILAHPERCYEVLGDPKKSRGLADAGCLLQVNLGSLSGYYGRRVAKAARFILDQGLAFCVASDVHGPPMIEPVYQEGIKELRKYGEKALSILLRENPMKVIGGEPL